MASDQLLTKNIGEEFTCAGEWWLPKGSNPSNPRSKRSGTLAFSRDGGITLNILGRLGTGKPPKDLVGERVEMIWGISVEGELITLYECQKVGITIGTVWTESYLVGEVFVSKNAWFSPGEDITFTSLWLQYAHLAEWTGISGFRIPSLKEFDNFIKGEEAKINYKRPVDPPSINVKDYNLSIAFGNSWPGIGPATQEACIKQHTSIIIEPPNSKEIPLHDSRILVRAVQNFLSLVMYNDPVLPLVIEGKVKLEGKTPDERSSANMRLLYVPKETKKIIEETGRHTIVFPYNEVVDLWENALNKLVTVEGGKLETAFDDFFAEYFTPPEFTEDQFMVILRALEKLHRQIMKRDYYIPKEEYHQTILKKLNEQIDKSLSNGDIDEDFQEHLKKCLSCGYQYSLSTRLNDLFTEYGTEFLNLFIGKNKSDFVREIIATYNWLAHSDPKYQDDVLDRGEGFALLNLRLELFTVALLLHYIGFPLEKAEKIFKFHKFDYLRLPKTEARSNIHL